MKLFLFICLNFVSLSGICQLKYLSQVIKVTSSHQVDVEKKDSVFFVYHKIFDGNIKLLLDSNLIYEADVKLDWENSLSDKILIEKRPSRCDIQVLSIILNDYYKVEEILQFNHSYLYMSYFLDKGSMQMLYSDREIKLE